MVCLPINLLPCVVQYGLHVQLYQICARQVDSGKSHAKKLILLHLCEQQHTVSAHHYTHT